MAMSIWLLTALALALRVFAGLSSTCYYAPGQLASDDYEPCHDDARLCCLKGDACLSVEQNIPGCWNKATGMTYIASCTDSTYSNAMCAGQSCDKTTQFVGLAHCDSTNEWTCCTGQGQTGNEPASGPRDYTDPCGNAVAFGNATVGGPRTSADSSATDQSSGDPNRPLKLGLGIGLPLGFLAIGFIVLFFVLRRYRRHPRQQEMQENQIEKTVDDSQSAQYTEMYKNVPGPQELPAERTSFQPPAYYSTDMHKADRSPPPPPPPASELSSTPNSPISSSSKPSPPPPPHPGNFF